MVFTRLQTSCAKFGTFINCTSWGVHCVGQTQALTAGYQVCNQLHHYCTSQGMHSRWCNEPLLPKHPCTLSQFLRKQYAALACSYTHVWMPCVGHTAISCVSPALGCSEVQPLLPKHACNPSQAQSCSCSSMLLLSIHAPDPVCTSLFIMLLL